MGTPHTLDFHYSDLLGTDTRTNKLLQNPKTQRQGSKNYRYDFEDSYTKANGFQHRIEGSDIVDIFEYKYRDVNTGQAKSEVLSVQKNGKLYKRVSHTLEFLTTGAATSYSFYYDAALDTYVFSMNGIGTVVVSQTMTMEQLRVALNALTGVSVQIVDQFGDVTTSSTKLAYLLKVVIDNDFQDNESFFWTLIPYPDILCTTATLKTEKTVDYENDYTWNSVPFPTTVKAQDAVTYPEVAENYEGISSTNLHNSIYITDGGFLMKYDGKTVYRAGVPHLSYQETGDTGNIYKDYAASGIATSINGGAAGDLPQGAYFWSYRLGFQDYSGSSVYGTEIKLSGSAVAPPNPGDPFIYGNITIQALTYGKDFPVFSAKVNGDQGNNPTGLGITLSVQSTHNILPGMILRQEVKTAATTGNKETKALTIGMYCKVVSVKNDSLVLQSIACTAGDLTNNGTFFKNSIVTGYYTQQFFESKVPDVSQVPPGFFVEIYRTKKDQILGPLYEVYRTPVPLVNGDTVTIHENKPDTSLTEQLIDAEEGGELPRAGKYVTSWQGSIVQAGIPADGTLKDLRYPTVYALPAPIYCQPRINDSYTYTEAALCDFQSIYWADGNTPEGFPFDGLHEFLIDSPFSDQIKGIAPNKDVIFAFKQRSTGIVSGDIAADLVLEILEDDIGCISHKTIQDIGGALIWLDKDKGFHMCVAGRLPVQIGYPISNYWLTNPTNLDYRTAAAANFKSFDMYLCAVGSTWFIYDYSSVADGKRSAWYLWERFPITSVLNTSNDEHFIMGDGLTWQMKETNTKYDYTDHTEAIEMDIRSAWLNYAKPTIDKTFSRVWLNSIQGNFSVSVQSYLNYRENEISSIEILFGGEDRLTVKEWIKLPNIKASAISIGFKNNAKNEFVRIQGWELEWTPAFDDGEPKR